MPCKHMVLCEACSQLLQAKHADCPICRSAVEEHLVVWQ
jgi:RNA polymerase subunit RPABC4/transcription elongation factor Spt4